MQFYYSKIKHGASGSESLDTATRMFVPLCLHGCNNQMLSNWNPLTQPPDAGKRELGLASPELRTCRLQLNLCKIIHHISVLPACYLGEHWSGSLPTPQVLLLTGLKFLPFFLTRLKWHRSQQQQQRRHKQADAVAMGFVSLGLRVILLILLFTNNRKQNTASKLHLRNKEFPDAWNLESTCKYQKLDAWMAAYSCAHTTALPEGHLCLKHPFPTPALGIRRQGNLAAPLFPSPASKM